MNKLRYNHTYRRHLPHIQPPGATLFVTFRLAGSLPAHVRHMLRRTYEDRLAAVQNQSTLGSLLRQQAEYREQKRFFANVDQYLDNTTDGPHWLKQIAIAQVVVDSLHYRHQRVYDLDSFCIMSNHVHVMFSPLQKGDGEYHSLSSIMHSLKLFTANQANNLLQRRGKFWQEESYDHVVRDEAELVRIREYILQNPVRAGLVSEWDEWEWTFARYL
ncbi:MAG: transposase [Ardenticatenales bacterium]|nr:transposase [Ardenticatenales bacterium]